MASKLRRPRTERKLTGSYESRYGLLRRAPRLIF
jgi:hypothetical protein